MNRICLYWKACGFAAVGMQLNMHHELHWSVHIARISQCTSRLSELCMATEMAAAGHLTNIGSGSMLCNAFRQHRVYNYPYMPVSADSLAPLYSSKLALSNNIKDQNQKDQVIPAARLYVVGQCVSHCPLTDQGQNNPQIQYACRSPQLTQR